METVHAFFSWSMNRDQPRKMQKQTHRNIYANGHGLRQWQLVTRSVNIRYLPKSQHGHRHRIQIARGSQPRKHQKIRESNNNKDRATQIRKRDLKSSAAKIYRTGSGWTTIAIYIYKQNSIKSTLQTSKTFNFLLFPKHTDHLQTLSRKDTTTHSPSSHGAYTAILGTTVFFFFSSKPHLHTEHTHLQHTS